MNKCLILCAGLVLATTLGGCGGGDSGGALTAEEERQLDNAAAMLEDNVFDTSADSLGANEADFGDAVAADAVNATTNAQ